MGELELSTRQRWVLALVATSTMAIGYIDRQALSVLAPIVTKELEINETAYGWLASAFSMAYLVGTPVGANVTLGSPMFLTSHSPFTSVRPSSESYGGSKYGRGAQREADPPLGPAM